MGGGTYLHCFKVPGKIAEATVKGVVERHRVNGGIDSGAGEQKTDTGIEEVHNAPNVRTGLALVGSSSAMLSK